MSVDVRIDPDLRLVHATFVGALAAEEMREYVLTWTRGDLRGFRELADVRQLDDDEISFGKLLELSLEAPAVVGTPRATRVAVVASSEQEAKARFFGTAREALRVQLGEFQIFSSLDEAQAWLTRPE